MSGFLSQVPRFADTAKKERKSQMRSIFKWRIGFSLLMLCIAALLLAACGGSSSSGSSESTGSATESTEAESEESGSETAEVVPQPPTSEVTEWPIGDPPKTTPPPKQNVIWLACELPSCQGGLSLGYKEASEALGWEFEQINYNPLKASAAVQEALNKNPDAIFITGIDPAYFEAQAQEAIKKGIPIFNGFSTEDPEPKKNGVYMNYENSFGWGLEGKQIAAWAINDSGGKAHALIVAVPEYPIVTAQAEASEEQYAECSECTSDTLDVSVEDIGGGKVPAKIVAYVQQHPDINYIHFTFGDLLPGVEAALEAAGVGSDIKFVGVESNPTILKEIADGKVAAWTAQPQVWSGWFSVDGAIRNFQGEPLTDYQLSGEVPTWVIDSPEAAEGILEEGGEWAGPKGFREEYEELWGLK